MKTSKKDMVLIDISKIGAIILQARLDKGMTKEQLASRAGITKAVINKIEMAPDKVKISVIRKNVLLPLARIQISLPVFIYETKERRLINIQAKSRIQNLRNSSLFDSLARGSSEFGFVGSAKMGKVLIARAVN